MAKKSDSISYEKAFDELQKLVIEIENGEISVDELSEKVKRGSELIKICKTVLFDTKEKVEEILSTIEKKES